MDDLDARFAKIVAGWDDDPPVRPGVPDEPTTPEEPVRSETVGMPDDPVLHEPAGMPAEPVPHEPAGMPVAPVVWRAATPSAEEDEHFEPPPPEALPRAEDDPTFWGVIAGLVGGPLLLLYVVCFDRDGSGWWVTTGIGLTVVGFLLLVMRGGVSADDDDHGIRL